VKQKYRSNQVHICIPCIDTVCGVRGSHAGGGSSVGTSLGLARGTCCRQTGKQKIVTIIYLIKFIDIVCVLALSANREGATRGEAALLERLMGMQEELAAAKQVKKSKQKYQSN